MNGISGVSGLTGGNCTLEEHRAYQRMEEEMMSEREWTICPHCGMDITTDKTICPVCKGATS